MYENCHTAIWRPVLKTLPVIEVFLVLCVLFRASLSGLVTDSARFLCLLVKVKCESFSNQISDSKAPKDDNRLDY